MEVADAGEVYKFRGVKRGERYLEEWKRLEATRRIDLRGKTTSRR